MWVGVIHDEVSLRKDLVFDDSGKLIGFVNLGSVLLMIWSSVCPLLIVPRLAQSKQPTCLFLWLLVCFLNGKCPLLFSHNYHQVICPL